MNVLGKTRDAEAYRISVEIGGEEVVAHVPDALLSAEHGQEAKVSHEAAYEWIATLRHEVEEAIRTLKGGGTPPAPFDQITLETGA